MQIEIDSNRSASWRHTIQEIISHLKRKNLLAASLRDAESQSLKSGDMN